MNSSFPSLQHGILFTLGFVASSHETSMFHTRKVLVVKGYPEAGEHAKRMLFQLFCVHWIVLDCKKLHRHRDFVDVFLGQKRPVSDGDRVDKGR